MRKIVLVLTFLFLLVITDFALWFIQTRAITNAVYTVKKELAVKGIKLTYEDISFKNFLAWEVKGQIIKPTITYAINNSKSTLTLEKMEIVSYPLERTVNLTASGDMNMVNSSLKNNGLYPDIYPFPKYQELTYKFASKPKLSAKLKNNINGFIDLLETEKSTFEELKSLDLYIGGVTVLDSSANDQLYSKLDKIKLRILNTGRNDLKQLEISYSMDGLKYNPKYKTTNPDFQKIYDTKALIGNSDFKASFNIGSIEKQLTKRAEKKHIIADINKGQKPKNVDVMLLNINNISTHNDKFGIEISGKLEKQSYDPYPFIDMEVKMLDYENMLEYLSLTFNNILHSLNNPSLYLLLPKFGEQEVKNSSIILSELSEELNDNPRDIKISINRTEGKPFTISQKTLPQTLNIIDKILKREKDKSSNHIEDKGDSTTTN